jgi:chromosome segregation ATPase
MTTPEKIAATIEKKQARRHEVSAELTAADTERATLRAEIGRKVADGQPTEALKKRLVQLSVDIESNEDGHKQLEADINRLKEEHKAAETAEASAAHAQALEAWAALLDDVDGEISELFRKHLAGRLAEIEALEQRIRAAEATLRTHGVRVVSHSEIERPAIHVKRTKGRARPLLRALRTYAEGLPYHAEWALHGPISHDAITEHEAAAPDWFKQATREAVSGSEQYSSEGMTLNELARL